MRNHECIECGKCGKLKNSNYEIDSDGVVISLIALCVFSVLFYAVIGLWAILVAPIVTLLALRPTEHDRYCWTWMKKKGS